VTAAVVLAGAPGAAGVLDGLAGVLDAAARARLQAELIRHAAAWADAAAPGCAAIAVEPASAVADVAALVPDGVRVEGQIDGPPGARIAAAVQAAFDRHGGPVLLATSPVPRLGAFHAAAALTDLDTGADATFGPSMDGGWYLAGFAAPRTELLGLAADVWDGPLVMARLLDVAQRIGLEIGLLRMERRLETPEDAAAFLVDPLTPPALAVSVQAPGQMGFPADPAGNARSRPLI
jgi:glycosyltransferase A (GT-A) superfamily protein (DUF2064 family)